MTAGQARRPRMVVTLEGSGCLRAAIRQAFRDSKTHVITDGLTDSQVDSHHPLTGRHSQTP
jgi:hypothetical protein